MTTVADTLANCRDDYLLTGSREIRNRNTSSLDATVATIVLDYAVTGLAVGAKVSIDLEDMAVLAVDQANRTLTVTRGDFGSTAATHAAASTVYVNSRFTSAQILRAVNAELNALSSPVNGLFQMRAVELTFNSAYQGFDLGSTTGLISIWEVRYKAVDSTKDHPLIWRDRWELRHNMNTADFASGDALFIRDFVASAATVRVTYKSSFSPLTTVADNVASIAGLHAEAHDILPMGAAVRLVAGREIRRNFDEAQGDTRRAAEVPPGANLGSLRDVAALREMRIGEERARLARKYPERTR